MIHGVELTLFSELSDLFQNQWTSCKVTSPRDMWISRPIGAALHSIPPMTMCCSLPDPVVFRVRSYFFLFFSLLLQKTSVVSLINYDCYLVNLAVFFPILLRLQLLGPFEPSFDALGLKKLETTDLMFWIRKRRHNLLGLLLFWSY